MRRLRYFWSLSKELNFRRTAQQLNITQPALSRAIVQLEGEVGVKLLERTNRHVKLTVAGHAFATGCERVLRDLGDVIDLTQKVAQGYAGHLNVGYTDTVVSGRLPDIIKSFHGLAPEIHIRLTQAHTERQLDMLDKGRLDVGFMTGPSLRADVRTIDIQSDRLLAILPVDHPVGVPDQLRLADLADLPFILGETASWRTFNAHLFRHWDKAGINPRIVLRVPESRAIIGLVSCGLGVSILPECQVQTIDKRLVARPILDISDRVPTHCGWLSGALQPALQQFTDHLAQFEITQEAITAR